ncbi:MAG: substrate-binding domain-containing protein [Anaerovoracaceae bacterium]|jgi:tungstate transport system substrate-binding protein|nr:substrate-binding domain-containing protein [Anaerovoracaceae bacterium]
MTKKLIAILISILMILSLGACAPAVEEPVGPEAMGTIKLATTTSTKDSGLLDFILDDFTAATGWEVDVISVGSGEAMAMGEAGEADVLLVHSPAAEKAFVEAGHADDAGRLLVMYNDFVIIGSMEDPAMVLTNSPADVVAGFTAIYDGKATFISRADESGTHAKEKTIWAAAALEPSGDWYVEAAAGMGAVIQMANEKLAYTLADRATWYANKDTTDLQIVCEKDPSGILNNQYACICVNPEKNELIVSEGAKAFQSWIVGADAQKLIAQFGVEEFGAPLFTPNAE